MNEGLTLITIAGPQLGMRYSVSKDGVIIGRSRLSDIVLQDEALSRQHCRIYWQDGFYLEDLASSNGTSLNAEEVTRSMRPLAMGDIISLGSTKLLVDTGVFTTSQVELISGVKSEPVQSEPIKSEPAKSEPMPSVVAETPAKPFEITPQPEETLEPTDLFKREEEEAPTAEEGGHFKRLLFPIVALLTLFVGATIALTFDFSGAVEAKAPVRQLKADVAQVEFEYENLRIDAQHLFRYFLKYDGPANQLYLSVDDLGDADRSFKKQKILSDTAKTALVKLLKEAEIEKIGTLFPERSADGVSMKRRTLTIVRGLEVWTRNAENVTHVGFDSLCEKLEFFARNELEVWAAQYSIDELEQMGQEQLAIAQRYWEQRDLGDDKLWSAIVAYKKGLSAIETLNPKPAYTEALNAGLQEADLLLAKRYGDVHFKVEQAINTQRYDVAILQLQKIIRMIPDREDPRHRQASEKLLTVEQRRR
jgi:pSer/pThr/pTyr-binding forkhead associated (FHA) protein